MSTKCATTEAQLPVAQQAPPASDLVLNQHGGGASPLLFDTSPRPGESMGSWLLRLAHANGFRTIGEFLFSHRILGKVQGITDYPADIPSTITRLVLECGASTSAARTVLLTDDVAALSSTPGQKWSGWVIAKGMPHSICPQCVANGGNDPSWQRLWRVSTTTHCHAHRRVLVDRCPSCQLRFGIKVSRATRLDRCEECLVEISAFADCPGDNPPPARFSSATQSGQSAMQFPVGPVGHQDWWRGVSRVLLLISAPHVAAALLELDLPDQYGLGLLHLSKGKRMPFRSYQAAQRARMLGFVEWLLSPWPDRFLSIVGRAVPSWPHLLLHELSPAWLADFCRANAPPNAPSQRKLRLSSRPCMTMGSKVFIREARCLALPRTREAAGGKPSSDLRTLLPSQLQLGL